ncbi:MAG: peptidase and in, kexin, sedolisin [Nocardioides sp.]|nr:peptidase and in, kexin, sedolisin [Nocardioides sp.]
MRWLRAVAGGAALGAAVLVPAGTAYAAEDPLCSNVATDVQVAATGDSLPLSLMRVPQAQEFLARHGREAGSGQRVAVVDSGVGGRGIPVAAHQSFSRKAEIEDPHGTLVAGLIAGAPRADDKAVGVAPGAEIVDVRIYDLPAPQDPNAEDGVTNAGLVEGLGWVADNAQRLDIGVVNVSLAVPGSRALRDVVARLWDSGVVVVAASGNRPADESDPLWAEFGYEGASVRPAGEDAATAVFPAGYPHVVAVSATADGAEAITTDASEFVLQSSAIDIAAPTYGGVSVTPNGSTCVLNDIATSWAAAEVSGVVALLRSAYPNEDPAQIVARLLYSANGTPDRPTVQTGAGVVQPIEALVRPLDPNGHGTVASTSQEPERHLRATVPEPEADLLAGTRDHAVWWGLLGGGALLLALILRPVFGRRLQGRVPRDAPQGVLGHPTR